MKKIRVNVKGMTCSSCEVLLERKLVKVSGVKKAHVSRSKEEAVIECDDNVELEDLVTAAKEKGYALLPFDPIESTIRPPFIVRNKKTYTEIGAALVLIIGLYLLLTQFNILPKNFAVSENMSYGFVFVIGLVAATSTCLAVAGGLLLALANKYTEANPELTGWQKFKPHTWFNLGRIFSYALLGGLIGLVGSIFTISPQVTGIITIIASLLMIVMGLQLLQIFPWLNKIQVKMPKFIAHKLYDASHTKQRKSTTRSSAFFFGGATFFLPCGFTQALQLYVLGKGDFVTGALTMFIFSLGTLPSLIGIGAITSFTKGKFKRHFTTFSAVLVIILGVFTLPNGMALTGVSLGSNGGNIQLSENVNLIDNVQIVEMKVQDMDYYPHQFEVIQGVPVRWEIDGRDAVGCAQVITAPKLGITEFLSPESKKVIEFIPKETGTIPFSCTMGMTTPNAHFKVVPNTYNIRGAELTSVEDEENCDPEIMNCLKQKRQMEISYENGFYPNVFEVEKNIPVELEIDAKVVPAGCMGTMVIPEYDVTHVIKKGKSTIQFTPTKTGTIDIVCSMGSKQAQINVV